MVEFRELGLGLDEVDVVVEVPPALPIAAIVGDEVGVAGEIDSLGVVTFPNFGVGVGVDPTGPSFLFLSIDRVGVGSGVVVGLGVAGIGVGLLSIPSMALIIVLITGVGVGVDVPMGPSCLVLSTTVVEVGDGEVAGLSSAFSFA